MKYKLTKTNEIQNYCSEVKLNNFTLYLITDINGKTIKEIAKDYHDILLMLMSYNSMEDCYNNNE